MNGGRLFSVRSARLIALGRAVLAAFLVVAYLAAPSDPLAYREFAGGLLGGYLAWSVAIFAAMRSRVLVYRLLRIAVLLPAADLVVFVLLLYATSGADSPFFSPFIFLILAATIQWGSRGAVAMGAITIASLVPAGWQVAFGSDRDGAAIQLFVLRLGYTAVITVLLMTFARHIERVVEELSRLSGPFPDDGGDRVPPVAECLRHALWVFGAPRGMLLWEEAEEPYASLGVLDQGDFEVRALTPGEEDWIAPEVAEAVFLVHPRSGTTLVRRGQAVQPGPPMPFASALVAETTFEWAMVIPVFSRAVAAWIIVLDHEDPANEDLAIAAMVGAQVAVALDRWSSQQERDRAAAAEARIRLARDLHDGVLQFLAGAGLQLDSLMRSDLPADAQERIAALRRSISDEQAELRGFISTLRPAGGAAPPRIALSGELSQLASRLSRYWTVGITAEIEPQDARIPDHLNYELGRIVREAVANAVRHGGARNIHMSVRLVMGRIMVSIDDDGRGFAFEGEFAASEGGTVKAPWSLQERVLGLDGRLTLKSSPRGASVLIEIPLRER